MQRSGAIWRWQSFYSIGVIGIAILHFFEDTSFVKEKIEPHIGLIVLLVVTLFLLFSR